MSMDAAYRELAGRLTAGGILSDPWLDGRPRFRAQPVVLSAAEDAALGEAAEAVAAAHDEAVRLCEADPGLLAAFYQLTPFQRLMWETAAPGWHGIARADVFLTADGPQVCELNSDTPSGEAEAVLLNAAVGAGAGRRDPNLDFSRRFATLVEAYAQAIGRPGPLTVGIIYPTELVEDLSMILLYRRWLEERGARVVLGSPYNLRQVAGRPALFDTPCDVFVRHYKTDWWGERRPVWSDEPPPPDARPLARPLEILLGGVVDGQCAVVNPFGAVVAQNKRTLALLWEELERFSPLAQAAIRRFVPYTARLESLPAEVLADRMTWVLKSDYGCEGAEVVIGADCTDAEWAERLARAVPGRFVAQRRFVPLADQAGEHVNHGVYVIGGVAAGYFSRVHRGATDYHSITAPTFVEAS